MATLAEVRPILSRYAGAGNSFVDRLNEVRARLLQSGSWKGSKEQIELEIYADADGNSIVTLPADYESILTGARCDGMTLGVRNAISEFDPSGLGYGARTSDFSEVTGRFAVYREWEDAMFIRLKFETVEEAGTIYLRGLFDETEVYSLYNGAWIRGEKLEIAGNNTVTSTKRFMARGLTALKPVTSGRIRVFVVDDDGVETEVGLWEPRETMPRRKRYKVPGCDGATAITSTSPIMDPNQSITRAEVFALFDAAVIIPVSTSGTTDLSYSNFFLRVLRITAAAGTGAYTRNYTLDTDNVRNGATFRIKVEVVASGNPTLRFYNESTSGTLLQTIAGDSSNALYVTLVFSFDGTAWIYEGRET